MNQDHTPSGERSLVVSRRFSSIPLVFDIEVATLDGSPPTGTLEKVGSRWIFGRTRTLMPLKAHHRVIKGFWDTFFDVYVISEQSVRATSSYHRLGGRFNLGVIAAIVLIVALAVYYITSAN